MKVSEVIAYLEKFRTENGDVELYAEQRDGHATWSEPCAPRIEQREIWKGHPDGRRYYLRPI